MEKMSNYESNSYINILYNKPVLMHTGLFRKIKYKIKEYFYRINVLNPAINLLKLENPSFLQLVEFSDFIKILEKVFFYNNCIQQDGEKSIKLLSDNGYNKNDEVKKLIISDTINNVIINIEMKKDYNSETDEYDENVHILVSNNFGKKLKTEFMVVNSYINYTDKNDYNLMYNINELLRKLMSDLLLHYYKLS